MPSKVSHYVPEKKRQLICGKGGLHEEQPLNYVCLDVKCRQMCLCCSVCFTETHKYHQMIGLSKFLDDYKRNVGTANAENLQAKLMDNYERVCQSFNTFKEEFYEKINEFELYLQKYAEYLHSQTKIREIVSEQLNIELEPKNLENLSSFEELQKSFAFILNNSYFDSNKNMVNSSEILKENSLRVCALADKMDYMTQFCIQNLSEALKLFNFAKETIKEEKIELKQKIEKMNCIDVNSQDLKTFMSKKKSLEKIIPEKGSLIFEKSQLETSLNLPSNFYHSDPIFSVHRHPNLEVERGGKILRSTISTEKPQFALALPDLSIEPLTTKEWCFHIKKCRDLSTQNTIGLGIAELKETEFKKFEGNIQNSIFVTSAGFLHIGGKIQKSSLTFREGDTVYFSYDPHYNSLEISTQNGKNLVLKGLKGQKIYPCVRVTYASDEVHIA